MGPALGVVVETPWSAQAAIATMPAIERRASIG